MQSLFIQEQFMQLTEFQQKRTPRELLDYFECNYRIITKNFELRKDARFRKEPYKTFIRELRPLSIFCDQQFASYDDVQCCLSEQNAPYDALIYIGDKVLKLEITWPIDGQKLNKQVTKLNNEGFVLEVWDYLDTESQKNLIQIVEETARKKQLRDYSNEDGSILLIAIDEFEFDASNIKHVELINNLIKKLSEFEFQVSEVYLVFMLSKKVIRINSTQAV